MSKLQDILTADECLLFTAFGMLEQSVHGDKVYNLAKKYILDNTNTEVDIIDPDEIISLIATNHNLTETHFQGLLYNLIYDRAICNMNNHRKRFYMCRQFRELRLIYKFDIDHYAMNNALFLIKSGITIICRDRLIQQYINTQLMENTDEVCQDNIDAYLAKTRGPFTKSPYSSSIGKPISDPNTQD